MRLCLAFFKKLYSLEIFIKPPAHLQDNSDN